MDRAIEVVEGSSRASRTCVVARLRARADHDRHPRVGELRKGTADDQSDLDVQVGTAERPASPYRMWFEQRPDTKPLHVSLGVKSLDCWLAKRDEPQHVGPGFPRRSRHTLRLGDRRGAEGFSGGSESNLPRRKPELEDFVEYLGKVRRCARRGDRLGARLFAREVGGSLHPAAPRAERRSRRPRSP